MEDEAGTLYKLLRHFSENNINLKKIESRPISNLPWKYVLYVDFEGNLNDAEVKNAISLIEEKSTDCFEAGFLERYFLCRLHAQSLAKSLVRQKVVRTGQAD